MRSSCHIQKQNLNNLFSLQRAQNTKYKMPSESTISNSDLMSRLSAKDTKKCYKNWTRGCKAAICGLCNVEVALSGNTTNGKRHLVNHHIEVVHSLLKGTSTTGNQQKEKTSQSLNAGQVSSRKRSAPASTVQEVTKLKATKWIPLKKLLIFICSNWNTPSKDLFMN